MGLKIVDKNIYLNNNIISTKAYNEQDVVEVVSLDKEHINDFYNLKNKDIAENIEVYFDVENYSLNLFKENDQTFISKAIAILDKEEVLSIDCFNALIKKDFSKVGDVEVVADEDSIEDSMNVLLSTKLKEEESIEEVSIKIDEAYNELLRKIF